MLLVGFIPGPKNPKNIDSFLYPLIQEFLQLEQGIPDVWNNTRKADFTLKAHICVVGADMPGREKLMNFKGSVNLILLDRSNSSSRSYGGGLTNFKGNRGTSYCPYCYINGVHNRGYLLSVETSNQPPR